VLRGSERFEAVGGELPALQVRRFTAQLTPGWVRRSFTQLARSSASDVPPRPDHDEAVAAAAGAGSPDEIPTPPPGEAGAARPPGERLRFSFVRGAHAGHCLHALLEATDFSAGVDAAEAGRHLERNAISADAPALARWLDEVLATPLADGCGGWVDLRALGQRERIVELPFLLPVKAAVDEEIFAAIAAHYPLDLQRGRDSWSGFLNGFIDLVYRENGRYYLLDWKSNWLGDDFADYSPTALEGAIRHGAYALQFSLYAVALHRMLGRRVPGYRFAEHFGGVHYAFLRGMAPGARDADGNQYGVYFARPPLALIERLDRSLAGSAQ
jgi:exodeoxyribonuclease V beta subunit